MVEYKVTLGTQLKNSWTLIIYAIVAILLPIYMVNKYGPEHKFTFILLGIGFFTLFLIPTLLIHLNYYFLNRYDRLIFDESINKFTILSKNKRQEFFIEDIIIVRQYKSHPFAENRSHWLPWDSYNHTLIELRDKDVVVVTSLLVPQLVLPVEKERIVLKKTWFQLAPRMRKA